MRTHPHLLPYALLVLATSACTSTRPVTGHSSTDTVLIEEAGPSRLPFAVSPHTRLFIDQVRAEAGASGLDRYTPSATTARRFGLQQRDGVYYFIGLATVSAEFDAASITVLGGTVSNAANRLPTLAVPLQHMEEFLRIPGIIHFALSEPVQLK